MRFIFRPPAEHAAGLLSLPWDQPLEDWTDERLLEVAHRGISRHVVRFVEADGHVYALKEIDERLARREYRLLGRLEELGMPAVSALGVCVERPTVAGEDGGGTPQDAVLVTRFLDYSMSYRYVFSHGHTQRPTVQLIDAMVELLVRLHLAGLFWGDCSLSNTLFRPDAGGIAAYLVDAETAELHPSLTAGQRGFDIDYAAERVGGELFDLQAGGLLPDDVDPVEVAGELPRRYQALWEELTREELLQPDEQRYRVAERVDRINELGFDVDEIELKTTDDGVRLRVRTQVAETGRHRNRLYALTGLEVTENQARRLLNDLTSYRGYLEQKEGRSVPETVAGHRWRAEVYDKVMARIPESLADRLEPAEIFHEVLEHRWFLSERAGKDVGTTAAAKAYIDSVLPHTPSTLTLPGGDPLPR
ncbi:lipopolysaccharide kinase [Pseudonocardia sp. CNS-004]|nr:lipopolysaccharide kinase [Pseudonocardia sp. CNS-004]